MWQAYVRFRSGSTTRADVAENEDDARKALEDAMSQLKSNGIGTVGPSLVVTKSSRKTSSASARAPGLAPGGKAPRASETATDEFAAEESRRCRRAPASRSRC